MRKKWVFVVIIVTVVIFVIVVQAMAIGSGEKETSSAPATPVATVDIGQDFPYPNVILKPAPASFIPAITEEQSLSIARAPAKEFFGVNNPETLPTATTIALFSGDAQDGRGKVEGIPVWIVVIKHFPTLYGGPMEAKNKIDPNSTQLNVAIDAQTGVIVHGVISSKLISSP